MTLATWADVEVGQSVKLNGSAWLVTKIKPKKRGFVKVTVSNWRGVFADEVLLRDPVEVTTLHDGAGRQTRWATPLEAAKGWKPNGSAEHVIASQLGGRLVSESVGGVEYVPTVDPSTIAAHLWIYHDIQAPDFDDFEAMRRMHDDQHERGELHVPHTHSRKRPTSSS